METLLVITLKTLLVIALKTLLVIALIALLLIGFVSYRKKGGNSKKVKSLHSIKGEVINRELSFQSDVVAYFKNLHLNPKKDTPFISSGKSLIKDYSNVSMKNPDLTLLLGVYHEDTNTISDYKLIEATSFDNQTIDVLAKAEDGKVYLS
jgi:hypothetical protein